MVSVLVSESKLHVTLSLAVAPQEPDVAGRGSVAWAMVGAAKVSRSGGGAC